MQIVPTISPTIQEAAAFRVDAAFADPSCQVLEVFTCPDKPGDPLPEGVWAERVTFTRAQRAEAIAWTVAVLRARWIMFRANPDGR